MAELTHPLIWDGWFHERNEMWKGSSLELQVKKILHVEKSKYQDVLVFESETFGNILVLDGAIQCSERDEFSYQEMIAHLPLNSHPNPENVLVIGGGDGGVLREVVKHPSVKKAVLCDIDEAVPRVSKQYLKNMAAGFDDSRVSVHIGDGFEFLKNKKKEFDVIITDSSDPDGPAEALFQTPYFQLLKESLREGGSISTQAESIWLHLPLISKLMNDVKGIFPKAEYAYTSIPTYPSGTIGFVVCSLDEKRNLTKPLREIENTKYYNPRVHKASFVLPEFARQGLANYVPEGASQKAGKKILLLGSGFVAQPAAEYILRRPENQLTIACRTVATAKALADSLGRPANAVSIDVNNDAEIDKAVAEHDLVISLIPYTYHARVIEAAIKGKTNVVTTSYVSDAMKALESKAKEAGIVVLNEIGLDPGIDHLYAVKIIDDVHKAGGKVNGFLSYCGGLPAPASADNPLGYKFSWSSRGVLLALMNAAKFYQDGKEMNVDGKELMGLAQPYYISPAFAFVAYPNRDSTSFREKYKIPEAGTVVRGTLRYQGFPEFIKALVEIGMLNAEPRDDLKAGTQGLVWCDVLAKAIGAKDSSEASLIARIDELSKFKSSADRERILAGFRWIGLLNKEPVVCRGTLLDSLCATLEAKMQYETGERDMVMLQHKFEIEKADGSKSTMTSTLLEYGAPVGDFSGPSAMAKLVGIPCGIATQLVLDGTINTPGILAPYDMSIVAPLLKEVEKEGIFMEEKEL